jgi:hypothetical protein
MIKTQTLQGEKKRVYPNSQGRQQVSFKLSGNMVLIVGRSFAGSQLVCSPEYLAAWSRCGSLSSDDLRV